jgi:hypothetical protein
MPYPSMPLSADAAEKGSEHARRPVMNPRSVVCRGDGSSSPALGLVCSLQGDAYIVIAVLIGRE